MSAADTDVGIKARVATCIVFALVLAALLWRLLDFVDELTHDGLKMSLGPLLLTGSAAAIVQITAILVLLFTAGRMLESLRPPAKPDTQTPD